MTALILEPHIKKIQFRSKIRDQFIQVEFELSVGDVSWSEDAWAWRSRKSSCLEIIGGAVNTHEGTQFPGLQAK